MNTRTATARLRASARWSGAHPNAVLDADGFYLSYNNHDVSLYGDVTTALVIGQMERFYILNGDHRDAYQARVPMGLTACLDYFIAKAGQMNFRSDTDAQCRRAALC